MPRSIYEIRVDGLLGDSWKSWFEGITIHHLECGQSLLVGPMDEAMLQGVLTKISNLKLSLVSVQRMGSEKIGVKKEAGK